MVELLCACLDTTKYNRYTYVVIAYRIEFFTFNIKLPIINGNVGIKGFYCNGLEIMSCDHDHIQKFGRQRIWKYYIRSAFNLFYQQTVTMGLSTPGRSIAFSALHQHLV